MDLHFVRGPLRIRVTPLRSWYVIISSRVYSFSAGSFSGCNPGQTLTCLRLFSLHFILDTENKLTISSNQLQDAHRRSSYSRYGSGRPYEWRTYDFVKRRPNREARNILRVTHCLRADGYPVWTSDRRSLDTIHDLAVVFLYQLANRCCGM